MSEDGRDDDDPQLRSLRAVWLAMPDEEPPAGGIAELMAAARVKADTMTAPSWWQRVSAVLRRPAVLALATVLVLIGGAVFIGQRRASLEAQPETAGTEHTPTSAVAPAPVSPPTGSAAFLAPTSPGAVTTERAESAESAVSPQTVRPPARDSTGAAGITAGGPSPAQRPYADDRHRRSEEQRSTVPKRTPARAATFELGTVEQHAEGRAAIAPATPATPAGPAATKVPAGAQGAPQPAPARRSITSDGFRGAEALPEAPATATSGARAPTAEPASKADRDGTADAAPSQPSRAVQYLAQAKSAVARGDCAAARVLLGRAARADAVAYRKALAADPTLKQCQSAR